MTQVSHHPWGELPGQGVVDLWVIQSTQVRVEILTLGAIIRLVSYRGKDGQMDDVVLGYDDLEGGKVTCDLYAHKLLRLCQRHCHSVTRAPRRLDVVPANNALKMLLS